MEQVELQKQKRVNIIIAVVLFVLALMGTVTPFFYLSDIVMPK